MTNLHLKLDHWLVYEGQHGLRACCSQGSHSRPIPAHQNYGLHANEDIRISTCNIFYHLKIHHIAKQKEVVIMLSEKMT